MSYIVNPLDRHNPTPLYHQLSDILSNMIEEGVLVSGDMLKSENELMKEYNVSRYVVRRTFDDLRRRGLIYTEHGRGSFVSPLRIDKDLGILQSYHKSMLKSNVNVDVQVLSKEFVYPTDELTAKLSIEKGAQVFQLERMAFVGGAPVNYLCSFINANICGTDKFIDYEGDSLYSYLINRCNIQLTRSTNTIQVIFSQEYESHLLNITRGTPLLEVSGVVFDRFDRAVEYSRVIYPAALFRFHFDSHMYADDLKEYLLQKKTNE